MHSTRAIVNRKLFFLASTVLAAIVLSIAAASVQRDIAAAQGPQPMALQTLLGTAFTYQGQLKQNGLPVSGTCDMAFRLFDDAAAGAQVGSAVTTTVAVSAGLFSVALDFGAGAFTGDARWLAMSVRCPAAAGLFVALTPRQALNPSPYALALPGLRTEQNSTSPNIIGGFSGNSISPTVVGATIGGGGAFLSSNRVNANYGTIGGGLNNTAGRIYATAGGGTGNTASGNWATVGGGADNSASATGTTIGGGADNSASGNYTTVGGGNSNRASGSEATIAGGFENTASGTYATVPGGVRGKAIHDGTFVWGDSTLADLTSTTNNQFLIRASGGVTMYTDAALTAGARLSPGSSAWAIVSDRKAKTNFTPVDGREVVARLATVPIETWNYKAQDTAIRHMGPMAQDFYATFGIGEDDKTITTVDADGVALAAIQGLHSIVQDKEARIAALEQQNRTLEERLAALEQAVRSGSAPSSGDSGPGWLGSWVVGCLGGLVAGLLGGLSAGALLRRGGISSKAGLVPAPPRRVPNANPTGP